MLTPQSNSETRENPPEPVKKSLNYEVFEDEEPVGFIGRLRAYLNKNISDIILLLILTSLTVINFGVEAKLVSLNFFYIVILVTGYSMGKRFAILTAFLTILVVWAFILSNKNQYLNYLSNDELNSHMTIWGSLMILLGWMGGYLAKKYHGKTD